MLSVSASSSLIHFSIGFNSASPLSIPLELLLPSSPMGSMLLSQMDISKDSSLQSSVSFDAADHSFL